MHNEPIRSSVPDVATAGQLGRRPARATGAEILETIS
jgi:hypothetical protein